MQQYNYIVAISTYIYMIVKFTRVIFESFLDSTNSSFCCPVLSTIIILVLKVLWHIETEAIYWERRLSHCLADNVNLQDIVMYERGEKSTVVWNKTHTPSELVTVLMHGVGIHLEQVQNYLTICTCFWHFDNWVNLTQRYWMIAITRMCKRDGGVWSYNDRMMHF